MRLQGKVILVTGSTTGIGKAIAKRCVEEGASVLVHGLERELGEQTVAELGEAARLCIRDLTEPDAPAAIVQAAVDAFGRLDGLVNNAALVDTGNIDDTDELRWDRFMAINLKAPYLLIRAALPHLEVTRGNVLNIGSVNAWCGEPELLPYSVSKGGLMTLTRNLGDVLHPRGVRVNQINPGWVLTENEQARKHEQGMADDWPAHLPVQFAPAKRIIAPAEIAACAVYFLGDECGPVSGSVVELEQYPMLGRNPPKL